MRRARRRSGFSLLELIVVIGLLATVSGMGTVMFSKMLSGWMALKSTTDLDRNAQRVLEDIGKDVAAMISPSLTPDASLFGMEYPDTPGSDLLVLPVALPVGPGGRTVGGFANYHVFVPAESDGEAGLDTLVREIIMMDDESAEPQRHTVAKGVKGFGVEFCAKDGTWVPEWGQAGEGLPNAIRISLTLADPDNPFRDRVTRQAVFPILVD